MVTLGRWGSSYALRLESFIVMQGGFKSGMTFNMRLQDDGTILVTPTNPKSRQRAALNELPPPVVKAQVW